MPITMTQHFIRKWTRKFKSEPTPEIVGAIIEASLEILQGGKALEMRGKMAILPAVYWSTNLDLMFKVDVTQPTIQVITFFTKRDATRRRKPNGYTVKSKRLSAI